MKKTKNFLSFSFIVASNMNLSINYLKTVLPDFQEAKEASLKFYY